MSDITSVTVAVATHKPYKMPQDAMYLPLHVGAALHPDVLTDMTGDDSGDNISDKNGYYSELTAMYWLWKNNHSDAKGISHYRRLLGSRKKDKRGSKDPYLQVLGSDEARQLLEKYDVILAKKRHYYIETIYSHYSHTFYQNQLDETRKILMEMEPAYVPAWDEYMKSRSGHVFNMFIMRGKIFDEYCAWLFPILFELENRIDPTQYDAFNARYIGRVSERLLDPWLMTTGYSYVEVPVVSPEPVNWWKKGTGFLKAKFGGKKYTASF